MKLKKAFGVLSTWQHEFGKDGMADTAILNRNFELLNQLFTTAGVQSITAGTNITITGTAQNPTINASGGGGGGVPTQLASWQSSTMTIASGSAGRVTGFTAQQSSGSPLTTEASDVFTLPAVAGTYMIEVQAFVQDTSGSPGADDSLVLTFFPRSNAAMGNFTMTVHPGTNPAQAATQHGTFLLASPGSDTFQVTYNYAAGSASIFLVVTIAVTRLN